MKVNFEVQPLCLKKNRIRGVGYYAINIISALWDRRVNEYSISYFDYNKERGNKELVEENLINKYCNGIEVYECNTLNYKIIIDACLHNDHKSYCSTSYGEYLGLESDIYHFLHPQYIPRNIDGKLVVTVHDIMPVLNGLKQYWTERVQTLFHNTLEYLAQSDQAIIITDSISTQKDIIQYADINPERINVIPLGYDSNIYYHEESNIRLRQLDITKPFILYVGALDLRKGIIDIIHAFNKIRMNNDIQLVFAGDMEKNFKEKFDREYNTSSYIDDIKVLGYVSDSDKRILISGAEIFLFPSEYEGFGLPVLEAMACGTPVITTNVSSLPEVGGDAVVYTNVNDSTDLADKVDMLLVNKELQQKYSALGLERAKHFSWDKTAEMTEKVYEKVMEQ